MTLEDIDMGRTGPGQVASAPAGVDGGCECYCRFALAEV